MWMNSSAVVLVISLLVVSSNASYWSFGDGEKTVPGTAKEETAGVEADSYGETVPDSNSGMKVAVDDGVYKEEWDADSEYMKRNDSDSAFFAVPTETYISEPSYDNYLLQNETVGKEVDIEDKMKETPVAEQVNGNTDSTVKANDNGIIKRIIAEIEKAFRNQTLTINININTMNEKKDSEPTKDEAKKDIHEGHDQTTCDWLKNVMKTQIEDLARYGPSHHDTYADSLRESDYWTRDWLRNYYNGARRYW